MEWKSARLNVSRDIITVIEEHRFQSYSTWVEFLFGSVTHKVGNILSPDLKLYGNNLKQCSSNFSLMKNDLKGIFKKTDHWSLSPHFDLIEVNLMQLTIVSKFEECLFKMLFFFFLEKQITFELCKSLLNELLEELLLVKVDYCTSFWITKNNKCITDILLDNSYCQIV